jgi:hypothetical protein
LLLLLGVLLRLLLEKKGVKGQKLTYVPCAGNGGQHSVLSSFKGKSARAAANAG